MGKTPVALDERSVRTLQTVCTVMYAITIELLAFAIIYRQFVLGQSTREFEDMAVILTLNVIVGLAALLYFGGVVLPRVSPRALAVSYAAFVALGFGFTVFKYRVLLSQPMDAGALWSSFLTVATICGLLTGLYILAAHLGHRRLEKQAR